MMRMSYEKERPLLSNIANIPTLRYVPVPLLVPRPNVAGHAQNCTQQLHNSTPKADHLPAYYHEDLSTPYLNVEQWRARTLPPAACSSATTGLGANKSTSSPRVLKSALSRRWSPVPTHRERRATIQEPPQISPVVNKRPRISFTEDSFTKLSAHRPLAQPRHSFPNGTGTIWLTHHLLFFTFGPPDRNGKYPKNLVGSVKFELDAILQKWYAVDEVTLAALYYIHAVLPLKSFQTTCYAIEDCVKIAIRMFVVAHRLAHLWLDDFKPYAMFDIFSCPPTIVHGLEKAALQALDYNLSISSSEWKRWLTLLADDVFLRRCVKGSPMYRNLARNLLTALRTPEGELNATPSSFAKPSASAIDRLKSALCAGMVIGYPLPMIMDILVDKMEIAEDASKMETLEPSHQGDSADDTAEEECDAEQYTPQTRAEAMLLLGMRYGS